LHELPNGEKTDSWRQVMENIDGKQIGIHNVEPPQSKHPHPFDVERTPPKMIRLPAPILIIPVFLMPDFWQGLEREQRNQLNQG
jgi:hypothetical protein